MAIYKAANYADTKNEDLYEMEYSETPLLIYSNYKLEKQELHTLSPVYFGPTVFKMAVLNTPPFYLLLDKLKKNLPGLKFNLQINGNQEFVTNKLTKKQKELLHDYELIEYDLLVGEQYSKNNLFQCSNWFSKKAIV